MAATVITVGQMREWEQGSWAAGKIKSEVMDRVGGWVAKRARQMAEGGTILILAGKGNNGEDARRAGEQLSDLRVRICNVSEPENGLAEINAALEQNPALIVDGLFGIGLNRPLNPAWIALINRVNETDAPILSVDVPSGLNADTGEPQGAAIRATVTLTVGAIKQGLILPAAWPWVGRLELAPDVGLTPCPHQSELNWTLAKEFSHYPPTRPAAAHKGDHGHLAIVAGSLGYHGAAVLAARGAQRGRPGLITLYTQELAYHVIASQLQAVMVNLWTPNLKLPGNHDAVLMGPGLAAPELADTMKLVVKLVWRDTPGPVVVDASALDWLPISPLSKHVIRVVTPHPGEAARLLRWSVAQVQGNRVNAVREISRRFGNCWVVLKGAQTLIGRSFGEIYINPSGNPEMAQGGSGDILAGYLAGLLTQPALQADALKTLRYGVWQHGATADKLNLTQRNWAVEDLVAELGNVVPS